MTSLEQLTAGEQRSVTEQPGPSTRVELDGPKNVSVTIAQPTPVRAVLQLLFKETQFSTVVHSSIRGTFSGELRSLTLRQALEAVLFAVGLDYEVRGTVIQIFPRRPSTRLYPVDLLSVRRSWQSRATGPGGAIVTSVDSDPISQLSDGVRLLLSNEGRHFVDRRAGVLHVTDFADRLDQVGLYLQTMQQRANRQVRVDVQVLRITVAGNVVIPPVWPATTTDVRQFIRGLEAAATVEMLASPTLLTVNNEPATVNVASGDGWERSIAVTPQVSADGVVQLHVAPRFVERVAGEAGRQSAPSVAESDSIVRLREKETAIISGLPYAADTSQRKEILVLLTPLLAGPSLAPQAGQR